MSLKRVRNKFLLIGLIIVYCSCEKIIEMKETDTGKQLVVNSIICPDSIFRVQLSTTMPVLDSSQSYYLPDRSVEVYENDLLVKTLRHKYEGYYFDSDFYPKSGKRYRIRILKGTVQEAEATTFIPSPVPIKGLTTDESIKQWGKALVINVSFADPASAVNYYRISLRERTRLAVKDEKNQIVYKTVINYRWIDSGTNSILRGMGEIPEDQIVNNHSENDYSIFADKVINGKDYILVVFTNYFDDKIVVESLMNVLFQSISPEYFYYLKSRTLYNQVNNNPFAEPVRIYSNIVNGTGIFAGFSSAKKLISYMNNKVTVP